MDFNLIGRKRKQAERGQKVREWLEDPLFLEPFEKMETMLRKEWEESRSDQKEARERIWLTLDALKIIKKSYTVLAKNGEAAAKELIELTQ